MNHRILGMILGVASLTLAGCGNQSPTTPDGDLADHRAELHAALQALSDESGASIFRLHFKSIIAVIDVADGGWPSDTQSINTLWGAFSDASAPNSPRLQQSYLSRSKQLIVAWVSPTDGQVSFTWLRLPSGWNPEREYPLYVQLHGLWGVADSRLDYMNYPFLNPGTTSAFEDGYLVSPWGRGNQWYRGISETDIWECVAKIKSLLRVDESRQYLCGHSMGGYGAWHIALRSANTWAALGVHAGALWYDQSEMSPAAVAALRDLPTYFVVGTDDGLFTVNQMAYQLLRDVGNPHLAFTTFAGGHEYRDSEVEGMYGWLKKFDRDDRLAAPSN